MAVIKENLVAKKPTKAFRKKFIMVYGTMEGVDWEEKTFSQMTSEISECDSAQFSSFAESCTPGEFMTLDSGVNLVFCIP